MSTATSTNTTAASGGGGGNNNGMHTRPNKKRSRSPTPQSVQSSASGNAAAAVALAASTAASASVSAAAGTTVSTTRSSSSVSKNHATTTPNNGDHNSLVASKTSLLVAAQFVLKLNLTGLGLLLSSGNHHHHHNNNNNNNNSSLSLSSASNNAVMSGSLNNNNNNNNNTPIASSVPSSTGAAAAILPPPTTENNGTATTNTAAATTTHKNKNTNTNNSINIGGLPSIEQVGQISTKAILENPPWVHWSKTDSALQLKIDDKRRLVLKGAMRGYRMARASHGVVLTANGTVGNHNNTNTNNNNITTAANSNSTSNTTATNHPNSHFNTHYYYEVWIHPPPTLQGIMTSLPPNARLGLSLQKQLQQALIQEEQNARNAAKANANQKSNPNGNNNIDSVADKSKHNKKIKKSNTDTENAETIKTGTLSLSSQMAKLNNNSSSQPQLPPQQQVGGHLRIGWSMRTGDLQAPVGYDKWSYGIRSIGGSKIHQSKRQDAWGGEGFKTGDVIGCAIGVVNTTTNNTNNNEKDNNKKDATGTTKGTKTKHNNEPNKNNTTTTSNRQIRFFKNGKPMGQFIISKGKREGGMAFDNIEPGTYYPAISSYMGGSCQVNFGPYFVFQPRQLPNGIKMQPVSDLCDPPPTAETTLNRLGKGEASKLFRSFVNATGSSGHHPSGGNQNTNHASSSGEGGGSGSRGNSSHNNYGGTGKSSSSGNGNSSSSCSAASSQQQTKAHNDLLAAFRDCIKCEASVQYAAHMTHTQKHLQEIIALREERNLSVNDLKGELEKLASSSMNMDI